MKRVSKRITVFAFFNKMKNNDYDCIIMSHDQFGKDTSVTGDPAGDSSGGA